MNTTKHNILRTFLFVILFITSFAFASQDCPKNIIIMIIDGAGFNHIAAADYYICGKKGEKAFEKFPVKLAMTTYLAGGSYQPQKAAADFNYVSTGYTDSAAAATAMSTGKKTFKGAIGIDIEGTKLEHLIQKCEKLGMATGVVTTVQISHGTPAGFVAHNKSRDNFEQIAQEMINDSGLEVIFGCGNPLFDNNAEKIDTPKEFKYVGSKKIWDSLVTGTNSKWTLIQSRQEFLNLADGKTPEKVLGVAQAFATLQRARSTSSVLPFDVPLNQNVPTLAEMTKAALNILDDDPDGFFVMFEAGAVDWASHGNNSARMIEEMVDCFDAIDVIVDWIQLQKGSWENNLFIITADHECGYLTGPDKSRFVVNNGKGKLPDMEWHSKNHTNLLVPFYAKGNGAKLFTECLKDKDQIFGAYIDNTDIAKVIFTLLEKKVVPAK
ncbi:MAG: alkaline phosphatase [Sedimentisphaerales bacterium]|nr:alkaline phosphatase [Sedimentisphaerales bacterium]